MMTLALRGINKLGNALTHRQRRFILDRLGLAAILTNLPSDAFDELLLPNGIKLSTNPLLHSNLSKNGCLDYEDDVVHVIERYLGPGDVFYDVGANVGVFAFLAATIVGEKGVVFAFEPEPNNVLCFRRSLERAPVRNVELRDCALGGEDGTMVFDRRGGAFSGRLVEGKNEIGSGGTRDIQVRSIDSLLAGGMRPPKLIKIDVEGGEGLVLEGAREMLSKYRPPVLCEMHPDNQDGVSRAFSALADAGYICRSIERSTKQADDIISGPRATNSTYHVLALPD